MQQRGPYHTNIFTQESPDLNLLLQQNPQYIYQTLSKKQISNYKRFQFTFGVCRQAINDISAQGNQPFERPIRYQQSLVDPIVPRELFGIGEIYNHKEIIEQENLICESDCDIEVAISLYEKFANNQGAPIDSMKSVMQTLRGDYNLILADQLLGVKQPDSNLFVVRDPIGLKPMYVVKKNYGECFYIFTTELKTVPFEILQDTSGYTILQQPPGTIWSFNESLIKNNSLKRNLIDEFIPVEFDQPSLHIDSYTPENTGLFYTQLKYLLGQSIAERISNVDDSVRFGILLKGPASIVMLGNIIDYLINSSQKSTIERIETFSINVHCDYTNYLNQHYDFPVKIRHHHISQIGNITDTITDLQKVVEIAESTQQINNLELFYLYSYIKKYTSVKVVISGDGLQELIGSQYDELDDQTFQTLSTNTVNNLYKTKLLQTEKLASSFGLEIRHVYLEYNFVQWMLQVCPFYKRGYPYKDNTKVSGYYFKNTFKELIPEHFLFQEPVYDSHKVLQDQITDYYNSIFTDQQFENYKIGQVSKKQFIIPQTKQEMGIQIHFYNTFRRGMIN